MRLQHKDEIVKKLVQDLESLENGESMTPSDYHNTKGWVECLKWILGLHAWQEKEEE